MIGHVFAYGSLLDPQSLQRTLSRVRLADLVCARLRGYRRTFDVAFPNDGSQPDKAYIDDCGVRPQFVLFANVVAQSSGEEAVAQADDVNGALIPVTESDLHRLTDRERRYELIDVTESILVALNDSAPMGPVWVFVGRREFTRPDDVRRGVLSAEYLEMMVTGVTHWDSRNPGFAHQFERSTTPLTALKTARLERIDISE